MTSARDCQNGKTKPRPKEPAGAAASKVRRVQGARLFCTRHLGLRFLAPIFQALARSQVEFGGRRATVAQSVGSDVVPNADSRAPTHSNAAIPNEALKQPLHRSYSAARRASSHTAQIHGATVCYPGDSCCRLFFSHANNTNNGSTHLSWALKEELDQLSRLLISHFHEVLLKCAVSQHTC